MKSWSGIRAIVCDVDGTLTDGSIAIDDTGAEEKRFCARDGLGIGLWRQSGGLVGVITGRRGLALQHRLRELGIDDALQGESDKARALAALCAHWGIATSDVIFVGDDLPDLAAMATAGVGVAVAGAAREVRERADYVTTALPGHGALREVIECALQSQGRWADVVAKFGAAAGQNS